MRPEIDSIPEFYRGYVRRVEEDDLLAALTESGRRTLELLASLPADKAGFRYEPGKWSIQEVLCHLMDSERIFSCRALRFARNDRTPLPGFEQDAYAPNANAGARSLANLAGELRRLRATTTDLFASFTPEMMIRRGEANRYEISVLGLGFVIAGHEQHHLQVLRERYV
ncbi:MAG: DinB family protein [Acidobacteria bacterium]|nr:DinB family protein [Acidobacteriota bacterium]